MAMMFITHDLGVVAEIADDVAVMYLGRVVERGQRRCDLPRAEAPLHPRRCCARSRGSAFMSASDLDTIEGMVPSPYNRPAGCSFHPRCREAIAGLCDRIEPKRTDLADGTQVRCLLYEEVSAGAEPARVAR